MSVSLSARNIVKRYGGVVALSDGNLDIHSGEVVALIGANGSGKSTMSKVINGVVVLDGGQLLLDGKPVRFSSPQAARKMGIATVFQELSLVPKMTVSDNIWLTREPLKPNGMIDRKVMREKTEALLDLFSGTFKADLRPETLVSDLHPDEKQIVEILKAVSLNPHILILDEATASLDSRQVERLFELVKRWKEEGKAIVFVSHRMEEIFRIADRYSVLRNGKTVGQGDIKDITEKDLIQLMTEKEKVFQFTKAAAAEETNGVDHQVYLEVENLTTETLRGISLKVKQGELLGIGGLQGQGQRDLLLALLID
jgi:ribose transport system ATP-binding protein